MGRRFVCENNNWIPSNNGFKCLGDPKVMDLGIKVFYLIIHQLGCWNRELVENIFNLWWKNKS